MSEHWFPDKDGLDIPEGHPALRDHGNEFKPTSRASE